MAKKQYLDLAGLTTYNDEIKTYVTNAALPKLSVAEEDIIIMDGTFTNQIPISTATTGGVYNATGFKTNTRWSSSGGSETPTTGHCITGLIPAKYGDILKLKDVVISCTYPYIVYFDSSKKPLGTITMSNTLDANGIFTYSLVDYSNFAYIRIVAGEISTKSIATINQDLLSGSISLGWLIDGDGNKAAPNVFSSQIKNEDGTSYTTTVDSKINDAIDVAKEYTDSRAVTVDSGLSASSKNPVQNKAITEWLADNVKNYRLAFANHHNAGQGYVYLTSDAVNPAASAPTDSGAVYTIESGNDTAFFGVFWDNVLNVPIASTNQEGITQLTDSISSSSTTTAATANSVKTAYDLASEAYDMADDHDHSAADITSGSLSLARGGTGADLSSVPDGGVIAKGSSGNKLSYWAQVPIERGGTGAATAAGALTNLGLTATATELNYMDGVTSAVQTQLDAKVPTSRTVNGKALSSNITLNASDVGASPSDHTHDVYVNQNAFSSIAVSGQTTVAADSATDTLTLVGSNVTITTDATNDKVTFSVADGSTGSKGLLQLTNSTSSTSTTTAATPNSVKSAYDLANTAKTNAETAQTKADDAYTLAQGKVGSLSDLGITATATELNYVDGVTSNIQTQLDTKVTADHTHSKLVGSTTYGSGVEIVDYNSSFSYLKPLHKSASNYINLGKDEHRFGDLYLTDTIYIGDNNAGTTTTNNDVRINNMGVYVGGINLKNNLANASTAYGDVTLLTSAFRPTITNKLSCGGSSYIWTQVYANKTTITSSDRRIKRDIKDLDDRYIQLFDLIEPKSYYLVDGDRIHTGFISQDVEEAMKQVGLTAEELAFFCKHVKTEAIYDENNNWIEDKEVLDEEGNPVYIYALRYEEYIAIMAEKIKRLEAKYNAKLEELDAKLEELDAKLAKLQ